MARVIVGVDTVKNHDRAETTRESVYYHAAGSKAGVTYGVTINAVTGHWCTCKGNISKRSVAIRRGFKRDPATREHWCKHVIAVLGNPKVLLDGIVHRKEAFAV